MPDNELIFMICLFFIITAPGLAIILIVGLLKKKKVKNLLQNSRQAEGVITEIEYQSGADTNTRMKTISYEYRDTLQVLHKRSFQWQGAAGSKEDTIRVYYKEENHDSSWSDIEINYWNSFFSRSIPAYLVFVGLCMGIYLAAFIAKNHA
ncbi:MAG: hypothetical protein ACI4TB_08625 [Lachnospiraceae bacterium]